MALLRRFDELKKDRNTVHDEVDCTFSIFEDAGNLYLQLDTYGSRDRQIPGKVSQSIQLDAASAAELRRLLERTFGG
jgi:hypothetical protein